MIAVVGYGSVGRQVARLFDDRDIPVLIYDPPLGYDDKEAINSEAEVAFICVPSPSEQLSDYLDTNIVRGSIAWLEVPLIVVRSTVNVGDIDRWAGETGKTICYSPAWGPGETAGHLFSDARKDPFVIVAGSREARREAIEWYKQVYPASVRFIQMTAKEAALAKMAENSFIATKLTFFNDLARVCKAWDVDYNEVREAVISDPRIGPWWTLDFEGWDSKCLSKDVPAFVANAKDEAVIVEAVLDRNEELVAQ